MTEHLTGSSVTNITSSEFKGFNGTTLVGFGDLFAGPLNNITDVENECPQAMQSILMFYAILSPVFLVGIVGNSVLILIFARQESMRTAANTYIFNLAVLDLVTILGCAFSPLLYNTGQAHPVFCKVFQFLFNTSFPATSYTLAALSAERYYAIAHIFQRKGSSKMFTGKVVIMIWVMAMAYVFGKQFFLTPSKCSKCLTMFDLSSVASLCTLADFLIAYLVPLIIITSYYIWMADELYFKDRTLFKGCATTNPAMCRRLQVRKKIAVAVLVFVAMFSLSYLPYHFLQLKLYFNVAQGEHQHWASLVSTLFCIGCLHNSINPVVLYSLSKSFRGHFNNYLFYNIFSSSVIVEHESSEGVH